MCPKLTHTHTHLNPFRAFAHRIWNIYTACNLTIYTLYNVHVCIYFRLVYGKALYNTRQHYTKFYKTNNEAKPFTTHNICSDRVKHKFQIFTNKNAFLHFTL